MGRPEPRGLGALLAPADGVVTLQVPHARVRVVEPGSGPAVAVTDLALDLKEEHAVGAALIGESDHLGVDRKGRLGVVLPVSAELDLERVSLVEGVHERESDLMGGRTVGDDEVGGHPPHLSTMPMRAWHRARCPWNTPQTSSIRITHIVANYYLIVNLLVSGRSTEPRSKLSSEQFI